MKAVRVFWFTRLYRCYYSLFRGIPERLRLRKAGGFSPSASPASPPASMSPAACSPASADSVTTPSPEQVRPFAEHHPQDMVSLPETKYGRVLDTHAIFPSVLNLRDIHGELDILAGEVFEAEDVFFHSFARL